MATTRYYSDEACQASLNIEPGDVNISCEHCGAKSSKVPLSLTKARKQARKEGFHRVECRDFCKNCPPRGSV